MGKGRRRIFFQKVKKGIVFGFDSRSGIYHVHSLQSTYIKSYETSEMEGCFANLVKFLLKQN